MSLNKTNLFIQASPLPTTFRGSPNDFYAEMIRRMQILSPSGTNFIFIGDTEPTSNVGPWLKNGTQWWVWDPATKQYAPADISASFTPSFSIGASIPLVTDPPVWFQTTKDATSTTAPDYGGLVRIFTYDTTLAKWIAPHPVAPNSPEVRIWKDTESALWSYDGGDGTDPSTTLPTISTGAMWQVDHDFDFRFPVGSGVNPITYGGNPATVVGVGNIGGEEKHVLATLEQGKFLFYTAAQQTISTGGSATAIANIQITTADGNVDFPSSGAAVGPYDLKLPAASDAHNTMPPYRGVYYIKRTARQFYTP